MPIKMIGIFYFGDSFSLERETRFESATFTLEGQNGAFCPVIPHPIECVTDGTFEIRPIIASLLVPLRIIVKVVKRWYGLYDLIELNA